MPLNPQISEMVTTLGKNAHTAYQTLMTATATQKSHALTTGAETLLAQADTILSANATDMQNGKERNLSPAMLDRLELTPDRLTAMADSMKMIAQMPDPVGKILNTTTRPNGLIIEKTSTPLGVIGIIYESRPNVTTDAGSLCLKSGNSVILRGGSDSLHSSQALVQCLQQGLKYADLPEHAVQLIITPDRDAVGALLGLHQYVDVIIPRGGRSLVERVMTDAKVPVLAHLDGICHTYIDENHDPQMAINVCHNAKLRRTGICGATETILMHKNALTTLPKLAEILTQGGCEIRGDKTICDHIKTATPATPDDWQTEYLAPIVSIKVVDTSAQAITHINQNGSHHTDAIITNNPDTANQFLAQVDSANVMHNTSTQFADGGEFGMGAEIGIATGKLHARGPVGADQLCTYKYIVKGTGQTRP